MKKIREAEFCLDSHKFILHVIKHDKIATIYVCALEMFDYVFRL